MMYKIMHKMLYAVEKDAIEKCKPAGEEDNKILVDAAVSVLELEFHAYREGILALEEKVEKKTVNDFLRKVTMLVVDGTAPELMVEIGANEYWARNPQGIWAMVLYIYLWGIFCVQINDHETLWEGMYDLLPENCHPQLERQMNRLEEKRKLLEKEDQEENLKWKKEREKKEKLVEKVLQDYLYGPPVFTNQELLETVHILEEQIDKLPDVFLEKVLHEMGKEEYHCFYVFNDKMRQRILKVEDDSFVQIYKKNLLEYDRTEAQKLEEEEILGAVLVMSGLIKRLSKQKR